MNVNFYKYTGDDRVLNKSLIFLYSCNTMQPFENVEMLNPILILSKSDNNDSANYIFISDFNRYYFVKNKEEKRGGIIVLHCSIDVLMSHKNSILNCPITCLRNENVGITQVIDKKLPILTNNEEIKQIVVENENFAYTINPYRYVLQVVGGELT